MSFIFRFLFFFLFFFLFIIRLVGPNSLWPWPIYSLRPKARAEKGYSPGSVIQVQNSLGTQPRTIQSSACPRSHRKEGQKWYRKQLGKKSKISVSIEKGMLESITTRESCPYCHSILCTWQSHTLQLFTITPNHSRYGLMGQISVLESRTYTWTLDEGYRLV